MQTQNIAATFLSGGLVTFGCAVSSAPSKRTRVKSIPFGKMLLVCFILNGQFPPTQAQAEAETINNNLTLSTALKRAIEQHPSLKLFDFRDTALSGQLELANLKPAYELGLEAENFSGADEFRGVDAAELTVSLSSVVEMGDKRAARRGIISNSRAVLDAQRQVESLALLGEVTRRYVDVLAAQERVSLAKEADELANQTLIIVRERADAGATPDAEVKRAQAAASQAHLMLQSARQQLGYLKVALAALWGETSPKFATIDGDLFHFGADIDFEMLYAKVEMNPAIQIFAAEERLKEAEVRLAQTQLKADISWSVGVRRFQESDNSALVAGFSMPLFSSKRSAGAVSIALAQRNEIPVQKELAVLNMHTQLFRAFHNRKQAILTAKELRNTIIPALEEALQEIQTAYQRGRYGYLEYVSARQELLSAKRTLIESASSALTYGAEIEQLTAEPLSASRYGRSPESAGSVQ